MKIQKTSIGYFFFFLIISFYYLGFKYLLFE